MRSGNSGHPRPSTDRVKMMLRSCIASRSSGQAEYVLGMYALILVMVLALASLNIMQYKADSDIAEDALAASCLAALDIDPYRYGTDHRLVINDPLSARGIFEEALRKNMNLNAFYEPVTAGIWGYGEHRHIRRDEDTFRKRGKICRSLCQDFVRYIRNVRY